MSNPVDYQSIITTRLENLGLSKEQVDGLADYLIELGKAGVGPKDVFPLGLPMPADIGVTVDLKPDQLEIIRKLLEDPKIREIRIFPRGIPITDGFHATLTRGR